MSQLDDLHAEMMGDYAVAAEYLDADEFGLHVEALASALRWSARYHTEAASVLAATDGSL